MHWGIQNEGCVMKMEKDAARHTATEILIVTFRNADAPFWRA